MADTLAAYGRANKTPEALVTAALILSRLPVVDAIESGEKAQPSAEHAKEIAALLQEAGRMRPEDALLKQLVARTSELTQEQSRSIWGDILERLKINMEANQTKVVATVRRAKGRTISAAFSGSGRVFVMAHGTGNVIASGRGSVTVEVPRDGKYDIVVRARAQGTEGTVTVR